MAKPRGLRVGFMAFAALAAAPGPGLASNDSFSVSARVLPGRVPAPEPVTLPLPPNARLLPGTGAHRSMEVPAAPGAVAAYYRRTLPLAGYRPVRTTADGLTAVWENSDTRIELRLDPVLGALVATRVRLSSGGRPSADTR